MDFKFKARGDNPSRKSRVYFSAHPDDVSLVEEISKDVLSKQNCAIFYCDNFANVDDDYFLKLSQMQLFIFPVTAKFLTSPSRAFDVDFAYAQAHSIPILPIMIDSGLERIFNQKCGNIQFLDKFTVDATAISYDKKLEDFLSETLFSDELASLVRQSFDAYVFLSYRKKDRKYANDVMRAIHSHEFARDIAIWFDEFLVAGEDFNDAISSALKKSDLFALVVTPNLVNEENYVMQIEYPSAKEEGKPIVAIESVKTDADLLKKYYTDIPDTVAPDSVKLSDKMLENLKNLAIRENDTPIHNYYIALAYLYGIDVEVNTKKAVDILCECEKNGLVEAMEKLVDLYTLGQGVEPNPVRGENLCAKIVNHYVSAGDKNNGAIVAKYLVKQAKLTMAIEDIPKKDRIEKAVELYNKALDIYKYLNDVSQIINLYSILITYATDYEQFKNLTDEADSYAFNATSDDENIICACYFKSVGIAYMNNGMIEEGAQYINQALDLFKKYEDFSFDAQMHLVDIYLRLGELFESSREFDQASDVYTRANLIATSMLSVSPLANVMVARSSFLLGNLYYSYSTDHDIALSWFEISQNAFEELGKISPKMKMGLYEVYTSMVGLYQYGLDDKNECKRYLLKTIDLLEELKQFTSIFTPLYLADKKVELATLNAETGSAKTASELFRQALDDYKSDEKSEPSVIMSTYFSLVQALAQSGNFAGAREQGNEAIEYAKSHDYDPDCVEYGNYVKQVMTFLPNK